VFDLAFLRCIPNLVIYAPIDELELRNMLYTAQLGIDYPLAIRYPRGRGVTVNWKQAFERVSFGKGKCLQKGKGTVAVLSTGFIGQHVKAALRNFPNESIGYYHFPFVKPLDEALLHELCQHCNTLITYEDGTVTGGFGSAIAEFIAEHVYTTHLHIKGIPDRFIEHGTIAELQQYCGLDVDSIVAVLDFVLKS
jgi:1-deoxy-D-xylulose-5-phosphate synthase